MWLVQSIIKEIIKSKLNTDDNIYYVPMCYFDGKSDIMCITYYIRSERYYRQEYIEIPLNEYNIKLRKYKFNKLLLIISII